jgi:hypothetical protein
METLRIYRRSLIEHARVTYDFHSYSRYNTISLINCMEIGGLNFFFKECKAPMADGLMRVLIKSRAGIQSTPKRKFAILHQVNGLGQ